MKPHAPITSIRHPRCTVKQFGPPVPLRLAAPSALGEVCISSGLGSAHLGAAKGDPIARVRAERTIAAPKPGAAALFRVLALKSEVVGPRDIQLAPTGLA